MPRQNATALGHAETMAWNGVTIGAIPAYNLDPTSKFHPKDRGDNGYVAVKDLNLERLVIQITGDSKKKYWNILIKSLETVGEKRKCFVATVKMSSLAHLLKGSLVFYLSVWTPLGIL